MSDRFLLHDRVKLKEGDGGRETPDLESTRSLFHWRRGKEKSAKVKVEADLITRTCMTVHVSRGVSPKTKRGEGFLVSTRARSKSLKKKGVYKIYK